MKISMWNATIELSYKDDFVAFSKQLVDKISVRNSDMIFAGAKPVSIDIVGHDIDATNKLAAQVKEIMKS